MEALERKRKANEKDKGLIFDFRVHCESGRVEGVCVD